MAFACLASALVGLAAGYALPRPWDARPRPGKSLKADLDGIHEEFGRRLREEVDALPPERAGPMVRQWSRDRRAAQRAAYKRHGQEPPAWLAGDGD
jgi:hypothetical protein